MNTIMKNTLIAAVMVVTVVSTISAKDAKPLSYYAGGGLSKPNGPKEFNDWWKMGLHLEGGVIHEVSPTFSVVGKIQYHTHSLDASATEKDLGAVGLGIAGAKITAIMIGGDGLFYPKINLGNEMKSFLFGGIGLNKMSVSDLTANGYEPLRFDGTTKIYYNLGIGVEYQQYFVQLQYTKLGSPFSRDDATNIGLDLDQSASSFPLTFGIRF
jgi:opacity protein-like surface antigen